MPTRRGRDAGFSLVEVVVALALMGAVMAASTPLLVQSVVLVNQQRTTQAATRIADDGIELARAMQGSSLLKGRGMTRATAQWNAAPAAVKAYLADMTLDWDEDLNDPGSDAGAQAALPTQAAVTTLDGVTYTRNIYVGRCRQQAHRPTDACRRTDRTDVDPTAADVPFFRVVVAVTWTQRGCTAERCSYVTSTLVSSAADPKFNLKRPPPLVTEPNTVVSYRTRAVSRQLKARGGLLPLTWAILSGQLPTGLTMSPAGLVTGTPTANGSFAVTVKVTDRSGASDNAPITWQIVNPLTMTGPANQTSRVGTAASLSLAASGGVPPVTWSVDTLPEGLSINATTGEVSGTPTAEETKNVTFTGTDANGGTVSATVTWQVLSPVQPQGPGDQTAPMNGTVSYAFTAAGGAAPYTWRAVNLPVGLTIDAGTGVVSGTLSRGTRYVSTVYARDSAGFEGPLTVVFTVSTTVATDLRVTSPAPATPNQVSTAGQAVSFAAAAAGGTGPYTWTAAGLPAGLSLSGATVSGTPTVPGTYLVTLTARDAASRYASVDLTWTVQ